MNQATNLVPPDGGWGWVILFSYVVINFLIVPMQQNFGLLFKDTFREMGMSGASVTSIISTNLSASLFVGTCTGPLIKRFGIRRVAMGGSILFTLGIVLLTFKRSYTSFIVCYGIVTGFGEGLIRLTSALSLNLYFSKRRRKVAGVGLALRSLGSMVFPHLIVLFLSYYGVTSTTLLIGGICFHTLCASSLLRPVKWYMRRASRDDLPLVELKEIVIPLLISTEKHSAIRKRSNSIFNRALHYYDLSLFKNTVFLSIGIGMTFAVFSDISFETLFALILSDLEFDSKQIALFVSTSYISNVVIRFVIPFVGDFFKRSSRFMYAISCCIIILGRFSIIYFAKTATVTTSVIWGIAHGMKTVYWTVIFADNIPTQQLPSAESIFMVFNGVLCLTCGPLLGLIKDTTGSYVYCVYVLNGFTSITCVLWSSEWIYKTIKKRYAVKEINA
ncbi:hypothetical protein RI129_007864 [Pyrocoelia pectoralis]|uniref:Uncharacterized protein n=1 Tax=Pyrocoelia pectoralis TaxID=417401 RepID=A0AAN7VD45_9COLE